MKTIDLRPGDKFRWPTDPATMVRTASQVGKTEIYAPYDGQNTMGHSKDGGEEVYLRSNKDVIVIEAAWRSIADVLPAFMEPRTARHHIPQSDIVEVQLEDGTITQGYYRPWKYQTSWMIRKSEAFLFSGILYTDAKVVSWRPIQPAQLPPAEKDIKRCPLDKTPLVNVGSLKEYDDDKDNHICPGCRRVWVNVEEDEWWTRAARVELLGDLTEGANYADIVKVII